MGVVELLAVITGAASVWLLANNRPLGWWVGLVSVAAFSWVFFEVRLFAEVAIQAFYFVTSVLAIRLWMRGGPMQRGVPVSSVPVRVVVITVPIVVFSTLAAMLLLERIGGAVPFWDALTTVLSLTAHVWLVRRYAQSWWIWVTVDLIYVPLYFSRGLPLTSALYAVFLVMAIYGLLRFRRELRGSS